MNKPKPNVPVFWYVQLLLVVSLTAAWLTASRESIQRLQAEVLGEPMVPSVTLKQYEAIRITPLYDDPRVVSDQQLADVLKRIRPVFSDKELSPNHVEHALRAWGIDAEFQDPRAMSGEQMFEFLTDHGRYLASWGEDTVPLLVQESDGVGIRWGRDHGASVHHDHLMACLTEAGARLDDPVYTAKRNDMTIQDVLQESLRDFRLDERETEWSAMAFGLWLAPSGVKSWKTGDGRLLSFDDLAHRLLRGHQRYGVCSGTHRVYSMMVLIRLDDDFQILSKPVRDEVYAHLKLVRDQITHSQFENGRWPPNWYEGRKAIEEPSDEEEYRSVIATGHHLEWLAIAPEDLHPPREMIYKASDWIIKTTLSQPSATISRNFTFYSHVGNALCLWRKTRPAEFWKTWQQTHPFTPDADPSDADQPDADKADADKADADKADADKPDADQPDADQGGDNTSDDPAATSAASQD